VTSDYADILDDVRRYYDGKLGEHGATARGVDWNSTESQRLRFSQLLKICEPDLPFSINDYGCGYGALVDYLTETGSAFRYYGFDVSVEMIAKARELHNSTNAVFVADERALQPADYTVASGIFNVRLKCSNSAWEQYVVATLDSISRISTKGFAFNVLTKYSDTKFMRADLYYADPLFFFDYCKTRHSRFVTLIHDYPLYEFTLLVRKE
jgi:SAM-dependent methyltransferase